MAFHCESVCACVHSCDVDTQYIFKTDCVIYYTNYYLTLKWAVVTA